MFIKTRFKGSNKAETEKKVTIEKNLGIKRFGDFEYFSQSQKVEKEISEKKANDKEKDLKGKESQVVRRETVSVRNDEKVPENVQSTLKSESSVNYNELHERTSLLKQRFKNQLVVDSFLESFMASARKEFGIFDEVAKWERFEKELDQEIAQVITF